MIPEKVRESLMKNWGPLADSMNCYAYAKYIDPLSSWACYVYALNPENQDDIACLVYNECVEVCEWSLQELLATYNREGEYPEMDTEYRPRLALEIYKKLKGEI